MIAKLTGLLDSVGDDWAVVDVAGVGYLVYCSGRTLAELPATGGRVSLSIDTHVREDHIHLYGFADAAERDWFRLVMTVQGVGAKVALALLTVLRPEEIARAIANQDPTPLSRAQGVGPRLARRLIAELREKMGKLADVAYIELRDLPENGEPDVQDDAISALVNLGYRRGEAHDAVIHAARRLGPAIALEDLIKVGLTELSS